MGNGFDRERAALTEPQLAVAESIDNIYEKGVETFGDGFQAEEDIFEVMAVAPDIKVLVNTLIAARAQGTIRLGNLLVGAGAAVFNDNVDEFAAGQDAEVAEEALS